MKIRKRQLSRWVMLQLRIVALFWRAIVGALLIVGVPLLIMAAPYLALDWLYIRALRRQRAWGNALEFWTGDRLIPHPSGTIPSMPECPGDESLIVDEAAMKRESEES